MTLSAKMPDFSTIGDRFIAIINYYRRRFGCVGLKFTQPAKIAAFSAAQRSSFVGAMEQAAALSSAGC
jgi:hypothetical protein